MWELYKVFLPGEKIQLEVVNKQGEIDQLSSQITEVNSDGTFDILTPIYKNKIVNLLNETKLDVVLPKGNAIYSFKALIIGKSFRKISSMRIEALSDMEKTQRRGFYRMRIIKEVTVKKIENLEEKRFGSPVNGTILDISAGGGMFTCGADFFEGDLLEFDFEIRGRRIALLGRIKRKRLNDINTRYNHSYGVRFHNITEPERNEIAKFVIEEQRRLIKKGLK